jgi:hypothetical protein
MNTSKQIAESMGGRVILADWFVFAEAEMAFNAGHYEETLVLVERAFATAQATGSLFIQGMAQQIWGHALLKLNRYTEAETHLITSIQSFDQGEGRLHAARSHGVLGMIYLAQGQNLKAQEHLYSAITQLEMSGFETEVIPYRQSLTEI